MSQDKHTVCDYSDSDDDFVPPSPLTVRRNIHIQCCDSLWAQWSSGNIISTLEATGIPISQGLWREDLLLLAKNTLGSPPVTTDTTPAPPGQTNQGGRKRTSKSYSPHPAKIIHAACTGIISSRYLWIRLCIFPANSGRPKPCRNC